MTQQNIDYFAISSLIISILVALKVFIKDIHLKKCHTCCINSDCTNSNNNSTSSLETQV